MSSSVNQQAECCRIHCREVLAQLSPSVGWIPEISAVPGKDEFAVVREQFAEQRPQCSFEVCCEDARRAVAAFLLAVPWSGEDSVSGWLPALLLRSPPSAQSDIRMIAGLAASLPRLTVAVDHFRHVELLVRAAESIGKTISVLVAVDTGERLMGVHPGPDCESLSRAVAKQRCLSLRGIFASVEGGATVAPERGNSCVRTFELARSCVESLRLRGLQAGEVVLGIASEDLRAAAELVDRCMVVGGPFLGAGWESSGRLAGAAGAGVFDARVISRPALEYCVIAAGSRSGLITSETEVIWPLGAVISGWNAHHARLQLADESLDLRIGSEVWLKNFHKHT